MLERRIGKLELENARLKLEIAEVKLEALNWQELLVKLNDALTELRKDSATAPAFPASH